MTEGRPAPYPPDVRAKGWRFELDCERIRQSDTWALTPPEIRPWLLMLWMTAWEQMPCGSLPSSDALIAARIGMPVKLLAKHRDVLMRGWWPASDGRLYHDTIAVRVQDMLEYRRKEMERRNRNRTKTPVVPQLSRGTHAGLPQDTHGTTPGHTPESHGTPGTSTSTSTRNNPPYPPQAGEVGGGDSAEPTKTEVICKAIQAKGVLDADPGNPKLQAYVDKGVRVETFEAAAITAAKAGKGLTYLLGIVKRQMGEAAEVTHGPDSPAEAWDATRSSIEARGVALGIGRWNDKDLSANRETFGAYTQRVRHAIETGGVAA